MKRYLNRKSFVTTLGAAGLGLGLTLGAVGGAPSAMAQEEDPQDVLVQLLQDSEGTAALEDEELKNVLIQLLQEKEGEIASSSDGELTDVAFQRLQDEDGAIALRDDAKKAVVLQRLQDAHGDIAFGDPEALSEKRAEIYAEFTQALADELGIADADEVDAAIRIAMMSVVDARVDEGQLTKGKAEALKFLIATSDVPVPAMGMGVPHGRMFIAAHGPGFGPEGDMAPGRAGARERIIEWAHEARSEKSDKKAERDARAEKGSDSSDSQPDEDEQG